MKRQTIIALGVAIILGLVAVFIANAYISGRERRIAAETPAMTRVAVASIPLAYGDQITADKVKFVAYPAASLPPGNYKTLAELLPEGKTRVALRPIQLNQPLLAADLSGEGQNASIAALLPDGMRAATVRINDISGVAGFIKPNDTVDVLITRQAIGGSGEQVTDVLLQNIRVIAIGQNASGANNQPVVDRSATLEVTPVNAQKLALGQQLGSLSLVLRKPGEEQNIPNVETVSFNDLRYELYGTRPAAPSPAQRAQAARLTQPRRAPPVRRAVAPAPPPTNTISVTRGVETKDYEVGGYAQ